MYAVGRTVALAGVTPEHLGFLLELETRAGGLTGRQIFALGPTVERIRQQIHGLDRQALIISRRDGRALGVVAIYAVDTLVQVGSIAMNVREDHDHVDGARVDYVIGRLSRERFAPIGEELAYRYSATLTDG